MQERYSYVDVYCITTVSLVKNTKVQAMCIKLRVGYSDHVTYCHIFNKGK